MLKSIVWHQLPAISNGSSVWLVRTVNSLDVSEREESPHYVVLEESFAGYDISSSGVHNIPPHLRGRRRRSLLLNILSNPELRATCDPFL